MQCASRRTKSLSGTDGRQNGGHASLLSVHRWRSKAQSCEKEEEERGGKGGMAARGERGGSAVKRVAVETLAKSRPGHGPDDDEMLTFLSTCMLNLFGSYKRSPPPPSIHPLSILLFNIKRV